MIDQVEPERGDRRRAWRIGRGARIVLATSAAVHLDGKALAAKHGSRHTIEIEGGTARVRVWV